MKSKFFISFLTVLLLTSMVTSPIRLPSLYFHENSTSFVKNPDLKKVKSSKKVLRLIYNIMRDNQEITKMEIRGHCDYLEKDSLLGIQRAKKALQYLVSKGLDSSRFSLKGFYKENLLVTPEEIERLTDEKETQKAHLLNRRVEFIVLETKRN